MAQTTSTRLHRSLTTPGVYLMRMVVFLAAVALLATILAPQFITAFQANPGLNGTIIAVLAFGIIYSFAQVMRLYPEIRWVNAFRIADPGLAIEHRPRLLAPMATMLRDRTGSISLSTTAMRSLMDSIGNRLDEARDTGRYLVGLLVFLGLLGTFWGLLATIQAVGGTINSLDTRAADSVLIFEELKSGLAAPLSGMGTAFASSLFGLSGSLVLGFLELNASQANNRFYNELEEWLSGITELTPASDMPNDQLNRQLYAALFEMQRALGEIADRASIGGGSSVDNSSIQQLTDGVHQLLIQMRREQDIVRQWVDDQSAQQAEVVNALRDVIENARHRA